MGWWQWWLTALVYCLWTLSGWVATMVPYLLDAAGESAPDTATGGHGWVRDGMSEADVLTTADRSMMLLGAGVFGMLGSVVIGCVGDSAGRMPAWLGWWKGDWAA